MTRFSPRNRRSRWIPRRSSHSFITAPRYSSGMWIDVRMKGSSIASIAFSSGKCAGLSTVIRSPEAERLRGFWLADEAGIVEAELFDRVAQSAVLVRLRRIQACEDHRLQLLE